MKNMKKAFVSILLIGVGLMLFISGEKVKANEIDEITDISYVEHLVGQITDDKIADYQIEFHGETFDVSKDLSHEILKKKQGTMNLGILDNTKEGYSNLSIAGHNFRRTFGKIKNIKIGDKISVLHGEDTYTFEAIDMVEVEATDVHMIEDKLAEEYGSDLLTLMTCHSSGTTRYFVIAKLI